MSITIRVSYDEKTKRLVMASPFVLADVMREYPLRRFDPKTKTWRMPLIKSNILHFRDTKHRYPYALDEAAKAAIAGAEQLSATPKHVPFPAHIYDFTKAKVPYEPYDHQRRMLDLAWGLQSSAWIAKMGTGKTYAGIHLAMARWLSGQIGGVLIICPSTLRHTWRKEFEKCATAPYDFRIHETKAPWLDQFYTQVNRKELPVLAASIEGFGVSEALYDSVCGFLVGREVMVICDESSRIKNPEAKRTKRAIIIGNAAKYRMILNGTPIAIGIEDLFSQYEFLDPNIIGVGDFLAYRSRYMRMGGFKNKEVVGYKNLDELMRNLAPYTIEVGKDVLNLPPKVMKPLYCQSTTEQKMLFKAVLKGAEAVPGAPPIKVTNTLEKVLRLRQIAGGYLPRMVTKEGVDPEGNPTVEYDTVIERLKENPKLDLLLTTIECAAPTTKFVIWCAFVHEIDDIAQALEEAYGTGTTAKYYGATDAETRSQIEDRYCKDPTLRFFIGNPAAAGLGLTLISPEDDVHIYYSGTNAYIDRAQSEDRSHRIGQKSTVVISDLIMEKTVDELIAESTAQKMSVEEYIYMRIKDENSRFSLTALYEG